MDFIQKTTPLFSAAKKWDPISAVFWEKKTPQRFKPPLCFSASCNLLLAGPVSWESWDVKLWVHFIAKNWCLTNLCFSCCCFNLSYLVFLKKDKTPICTTSFSGGVLTSSITKLEGLIVYSHTCHFSIRYIPEQKKKQCEILRSGGFNKENILNFWKCQNLTNFTTFTTQKELIPEVGFSKKIYKLSGAIPKRWSSRALDKFSTTKKNLHFFFQITLPKFNIAPEKLPGPNRKVVFQPPFFGGYVKLRGCIPSFCWVKATQQGLRLLYYAPLKAHRTQIWILDYHYPPWN